MSYCWLVKLGEQYKLALIQDTLQADNRSVLGLSSVVEALRTAVFRSPFSFIIIDALCWIETNDRVKESFISALCGVPLLLLVAASDAGTFRKVNDLAADGYLVKGACPELYITSINLAITHYNEKLKSRGTDYAPTLINSDRDSVLVLDSEYKILSCNEAAARSASQTTEPLRGRFVGEIAWQRTDPKFFTRVDTAIRGRRIVNNIYDHNGHHFECFVYPIFNPAGEVDGCVIHTKDRAKYSQTENTTGINLVSHADAYRTVPEVVAITDINGIILAYGDTIQEHIHLRHELVTTPFLWDYIPANERGRLMVVLGEVVARGHGKRIGVVDGGDDLFLYLHPLRNAAGEVTHIVAFRCDGNYPSDVKSLSTLVHEITHRMRNILMSLLGLILIEEQFRQTPVFRECESMFVKISQRVYGLLEVHSILSDRAWKDVALRELVNRLVDISIKNIPTGSTIEKTITGSDIRVPPRQASGISLIVNELVTNSIKHAFAGRETLHLVISISKMEDIIEFIYRDDGPGFPSDVLSLRGSGAGLYIIRRLVEHDLRGGMELSNDNGAVCCIRHSVKG